MKNYTKLSEATICVTYSAHYYTAHTLLCAVKYDKMFRHLVGVRKFDRDERNMVVIDWLALTEA